jgi:hypothetical protein
MLHGKQARGGGSGVMDWLMFGAIAAGSFWVGALGAYVMMRKRVLYSPPRP